MLTPKEQRCEGPKIFSVQILQQPDKVDDLGTAKIHQSAISNFFY
jgi:hypothetical protein